MGVLELGDTYKHITDVYGDEYIDFCPHCFLGESTIETMSTCPTAEKGSENNDIMLFETSAKFHAIFGGHVKVGVNLSDFFTNLFD